MRVQWEEEQGLPEELRTLLHIKLDDEEPLVIIATSTMLAWAQQWGHGRPVSMDCTFGLTKYGYAVCTLTVVNGQGRGVPICVAIMKREDADTFEAVIRALKARLPQSWRPSMFLVDDDKAEQKAIRYVSSVWNSYTACLCLDIDNQLFACMLATYMRARHDQL
jgi:hypothetical protein